MICGYFHLRKFILMTSIFADTDSGVDDSTQHQRPKSARGIAPINTTLPSINTNR